MLTVGTYLADRYEIVSKIGAGGMSDVYKAKDHVLGRFVAIKVLKPEFSEDRGFVAKFRTEAQSAAGLEHPNIVNIYDVGSEEGLHYIVMEYVEGITLKTYIEKKGQLSFKEAVSIAIQVARGIEAAHNKQIIHRDIKPQNIMISTEGKVKVMDFGIARAASSNTVSSDVMGSVHYSSPEQRTSPHGSFCVLHSARPAPARCMSAAFFKEGAANGYLLKRADGKGVWQTDNWQAGMGLVDFTNPDAVKWYTGKLKTVLDCGVDCFKTDFGERIPVDVVYHDGSDPQAMHNYSNT